MWPNNITILEPVQIFDWRSTTEYIFYKSNSNILAC